MYVKQVSDFPASITGTVEPVASTSVALDVGAVEVTVH